MFSWFHATVGKLVFVEFPRFLVFFGGGGGGLGGGGAGRGGRGGMVVSVFKLWTFNRITKNPNQGFFLGGGAGAGAGWAGTGVLGKERGGRGSQSNNSHITRIYIAINFHRDIPYGTF